MLLLSACERCDACTLGYTINAATTNAAIIPRTSNSSKSEKPFLLFMFLINTVFFISFISPLFNKMI